MSVRRKILLTLSAAALGLAAQTASASAAVHPLTANNCGTNGDSGVFNCMYVDGSGLYAYEVRGWSEYDAFGNPVHEQVTGPDGVVCNSSTVTPYDPETVVGCQVYPGDPGKIAGGTYCSNLWEFYSGKYHIEAENCVSVFS
jgi:hypothetical protein